MAEKKKTNMNMQIDSELWDQLIGLAKFKKKDRNELLEQAIRELLEKEKGD